MIVKKIKAAIELLKKEIKEVHEELDRADSYDAYLFERKQKLVELQGELAQNEKMLRQFEPTEDEVVNL